MQNRHYYKLPGDESPSMATCGTIVLVVVFIVGTVAFIVFKTAGVI